MESAFVIASPIGSLEIKAESNRITGIALRPDTPVSQGRPPQPVIGECISQLREYFDRERRDFDFPYNLIGTHYRCKVWEKTAQIRLGHTLTYKELAMQVGDARHSRSVAQALHHNPLLIVIPCHRVIGSNGSLTGFGAGLPVKEWLLRHENDQLSF